MRHILQNIINSFKRSTQTNYISKIPRVDYSKDYNIDKSLKDDFHLNLQKTIAWTEKIITQIENKSEINYSKVLRATNPIYEGKPFYKFHDNFHNDVSTPDIPFNYAKVLANVFEARNDSTLHNDIDQLGKILKFEIDLTTHDGAPCAESSGFVDESDIPPIDTWIYITQKYLYCWIPTMFIDKMQSAIEVEIYGSYSWLEECDPELNQYVLSLSRQSGG